jgi:hypothetical protein
VHDDGGAGCAEPKAHSNDRQAHGRGIAAHVVGSGAFELGLGFRLGITFTRGFAHAPNPTMHRPSAANTATFKSASIMLAITEIELSLEVVICRRLEIFPAALSAK